MTIFDLSTAIGIIIEGGAQKLIEGAQRNECILRVLSRLGFKHDQVPTDFDGVYIYSLVEYGIDKPKIILEVFRQDIVRNAFRKSFEQQNAKIVRSELSDFLDSEIGRQLYNLDYDLEKEVALLETAFLVVTERSRTVVEVRQEQKLNSIHDDIRKTLDRIRQMEENAKSLTARPDVVSAQQINQNKGSISISAEPGSLEYNFWTWFEQNSSRLYGFANDPDNIPDENDPLLQELNSQLYRVAEGLTWQFGSEVDHSRELVISADGNRKLFSQVIRLVNSAPKLPKWKFVAFRSPIGTDFSVTFKGITLDTKNIWFIAKPNWDKLDLFLYIKGLTSRNKELFSHTSLLVLDGTLGEYDVETKIGCIDCHPLVKQPERAGLLPFQELPEVVRQWKPMDFDEIMAQLSNLKRALKIYICNEFNDNNSVRKLYKRLLREGFNPWFKEENLLPGTNPKQAIFGAIKSADACLICISSRTNPDSGNFKEQIEQIIQLAKQKEPGESFLIPVLLDNCIVPEELNHWHPVGLTDKKGYERLIISLKNIE